MVNQVTQPAYPIDLFKGISDKEAAECLLLKDSDYDTHPQLAKKTQNPCILSEAVYANCKNYTSSK